MGGDIVRIGAARSIQYALRDGVRGLPDMAIHRVDAAGRITLLGQLVPVRPNGFVMQQADGTALHSEGVPWWLLDMLPQGFLGRALASKLAASLGFPARLSAWSDTQMLRALLTQGHDDAVGNLVLGDGARERLLAVPLPQPIAEGAKAFAYVQLAAEAASGDLSHSSAGGEQPKFATFAHTPAGPRHVLVKFTLAETNPVTERWRDLLLAEHHALETLAASGVAAAPSRVVDAGGQRFLEVERFDRVGETGRRAVFSLASLDAEFVGNARAPWPQITAQLASDGHVTHAAAAAAALLFAFGTLIGNTDMHNGNLSFTSENGQRPFVLAPAYDMLPMGFAPQASGGMADTLAPVHLHASVGTAVWVQAAGLALHFLERIRADARFSARFQPCIASLANHVENAGGKIARLG